MLKLSSLFKVPLQRLFRPASSFIHPESSSLWIGTFQYESRTTEHTESLLFLTNPLDLCLRRCYCSVAPQKTDDKHSAMYEKVLKTARRGLQKRYRDRRNDIVDLIDSLLALNVSKYDITWLLAETPELLNYCQDFHNQASWLVQQGFIGTELATLLHGDPSVVRLNQKKILQSFENLRMFGYSEGLIQRVIAKHPDLLYLSPQALNTRKEKLKSIFRKGEVEKLAYDLPVILTCDWDELMDKVVYVNHQMGLDQGHILRTDLLGHDLLHIKTRHVFLKRAGIYAKPDKHGVTQIDNPNLDDIMDTPDDIFAEHIAGMPLGEFLAFKDIYRMESEASRWDEDGVDEESDGESSDEEDTFDRHREK